MLYLDAPPFRTTTTPPETPGPRQQKGQQQRFFHFTAKTLFLLFALAPDADALEWVGDTQQRPLLFLLAGPSGDLLCCGSGPEICALRWNHDASALKVVRSIKHQYPICSAAIGLA